MEDFSMQEYFSDDLRIIKDILINNLKTIQYKVICNFVQATGQKRIIHDKFQELYIFRIMGKKSGFGLKEATTCLLQCSAK
jgi:hypothetical protein